jgi:glycosyltransferase involved in cell wall biosynthesis
MRIAFVHTYPIYHDLIDTEAWLGRINRERWMPGLLAEMGHEVELWAADRAASTHVSVLADVAPYTIRLFASTAVHRPSKQHASPGLVDHARSWEADLHILKGTDGGVGLRLLGDYLVPEGRPYVFVIGGKCYTRHVPSAAAVLYETEEQRRHLVDPGWRVWRRPVDADRLIRLPKSIDTSVFAPRRAEPRWDVVTVGRLIPRYKDYAPLGRLADRFAVAVVGDGPARAALEQKHPGVDWLGMVPNERVPDVLNRARTFFHPGTNDYFPRVLAEAAGCGLPLLAFADGIAPDVIAPGRGVRLDRAWAPEVIEALLNDPALRADMGRRARRWAETDLHQRSTAPALEQMIERVRETRAVSPG